MKELLAYHFSWWAFGLTLLFLVLGYMLLTVLSKILNNIAFFNQRLPFLGTTTRKLLVLYEPFALVFGIGVFIFVNLLLHGVCAFIILFFGADIIRNYMAGKMVEFRWPDLEGNLIRMGEVEGRVSHMWPWGLDVQTSRGVDHLPYQQLLRERFTVIAHEGSEVERQLHITFPDTAGGTPDNIEDLMDVLMAIPYLNTSRPPQLLYAEPDNVVCRVQVLMRRKDYADELLQLLKEYGYACQIR